jgi:uncharacterized protein
MWRAGTRAGRIGVQYRTRFVQYISAVATQPQVSHEVMIKATQTWMQSVVVKFRLCPWAAKHLHNVEVTVLEDESMVKYEERAAQALHDECTEIVADFANNSDKNLSRFIVLPQLNVFEDFLEFAETLNALLEYTELDSKVQIATFHPKYQFVDTVENDAENWSNRSPFPTLHLLKVSDVTAAVESYEGSTDEIWEKNIATMRAQGNMKMEVLLNTIIADSQK